MWRGKKVESNDWGFLAGLQFWLRTVPRGAGVPACRQLIPGGTAAPCSCPRAAPVPGENPRPAGRPWGPAPGAGGTVLAGEETGETWSSAEGWHRRMKLQPRGDAAATVQLLRGVGKPTLLFFVLCFSTKLLRILWSLSPPKTKTGGISDQYFWEAERGARR